MNDVIVVGGGFAGLAAALQLGRTRRKTIVLDTGLPRNRYASHSHGLLGHDNRSPGEILDLARAQLRAYPDVELVKARAESASGRVDDFAVTTETGETFQARRLLLSYGLTDQFPSLPGFAQCWGKTIVPCPYCHGYEIADTRWGLLYHSPMSLHMPPLYRHWTDQITLFTDGHELPEGERDKLLARGVTVVDGKVVAIVHDVGRLAAVALADGREVAIDTLFAHPRNTPSGQLHRSLGLAMTETPMGEIINVDERQATSLPGVYAGGDLTTSMNSLTVAIHAGTMAGIFAQQSLVV